MLRSRSSTALAARRASRSSSLRVAAATCASLSATAESPLGLASRSMFWISTLMTGGIRPPAGAGGLETGLRRRRPRRRGGLAGLSGVKSLRSVKASRHEQTMAGRGGDGHPPHWRSWRRSHVSGMPPSANAPETCLDVPTTCSKRKAASDVCGSPPDQDPELPSAPSRAAASHRRPEIAAAHPTFERPGWAARCSSGLVRTLRKSDAQEVRGPRVPEINTDLGIRNRRIEVLVPDLLASTSTTGTPIRSRATRSCSAFKSTPTCGAKSAHGPQPGVGPTRAPAKLARLR